MHVPQRFLIVDIPPPRSFHSSVGFEYATLAYSLSEPASSRPFSPHKIAKVIRENELPPSLQRRQDPFHEREAKNAKKLSLLKVTILAEDAGKALPPGHTWSTPSPVTVGTSLALYCLVSSLLCSPLSFSLHVLINNRYNTTNTHGTLYS